VTNLELRLAEEKDCRLIWEWANDPTVRANAFNPEPILWESHKSWYQKKLASPDTRLWILELDKTPVAQIRYDRVDVDTAEIDFSVTSSHRGKGLGTKILKYSSELACAELGVKYLKGLVLDRNSASIFAFTKADFQPMGREEYIDQPCQVFVYQRFEQV